MVTKRPQTFIFFFLILFSSLTWSGVAKKAKERKEPKVFQASLWMEQLKAPVSTGYLIYVDSVFAVFKAKRALMLSDIHQNVVLQINDGTTLSKAFVVDYDIPTGWFLVRIKKSEIVAPKIGKSSSQLADIAIHYKISPLTEKKSLIEAFEKFSQSLYQRSVAEEKGFAEVLEVEMKRFGDKLTQNISSSQRKINLSERDQIPLPLVDNCTNDSQLRNKTKNEQALKLEKSIKCEFKSYDERGMASDLRPDVRVYMGLADYDEPYLKTKQFNGQMELLSTYFDEQVTALLVDNSQCINHWISERQIYVKSCIERNSYFKGLYNAVHVFGFYHNKKMIYNVVALNGFTDSNQKEIVAKFLNEMRGNVL